MPLGWAAGATALAGVAGAGASIYGSSQASKAANKAANLQNDQYQTTRGDLQPFIGAGSNALQPLSDLANAGVNGGGPDYLGQAASNLPGTMTQEQLEATPGYQFTLGQGLKSVQSAAAARGLGVSGAALKGASNYATGLANNTYKDQFNIAQQRFSDYLNLNTGSQGNVTNQFNRLNSIATLGANAASGLGTQGTNAANAAGSYLNAAGIDTASGTRDASNALTGAVNNYYKNDYLQKMTMGGYQNPANQTGGGGKTNTD